MRSTSVDVWEWLHRVVGWDGLLPLGIAAVPHAVDFLLPGNDKALALVAVLAPIAALLVRFHIGRRHLASNRVGPVFRTCQWVVFGAAIFLLLLLDSFVIIAYLVPAWGRATGSPWASGTPCTWAR